MTTKPIVNIILGGTEAIVDSPFEARDAIASLPKTWRTWDKTQKCWTVATHAVTDLQHALEEAGFKVVIRRPGDRKAARGRASRDGQTWADSMFADLGQPLADKAYKALVAVLHPDRGGSLTAMQDLNAARDRAVRK